MRQPCAVCVAITAMLCAHCISLFPSINLSCHLHSNIYGRATAPMQMEQQKKSLGHCRIRLHYDRHLGGGISMDAFCREHVAQFFLSHSVYGRIVRKFILGLQVEKWNRHAWRLVRTRLRSRHERGQASVRMQCSNQSNTMSLDKGASASVIIFKNSSSSFTYLLIQSWW